MVVKLTRTTISYAREAPIESALVADGKEIGLRSLKLKLQYDAGWPDRLWLFDRGRTFWCEYKKPGVELDLRGLQAHRIAYLRSLGHDAAWYNDYDAAWAALKERV